MHGGRVTVTRLTDTETKVYRAIFVAFWIFLLGIMPWLAWEPTDSGRTIAIRVALSILSTPTGHLFGWRWGFWPGGFIQRSEPQAEGVE
jgi:hypothetical protein